MARILLEFTFGTGDEHGPILGGQAMDGVLTDLSQAVASIRRQPTFLAAAVLTLAIGIGGTTAIFSLLNGVVLKPLPYRDSDQLVRLTCPAGSGFFSRPDFLDIREQATSFRELGSFIDYSIQGFDLTGEGAARRVAAMPVSAGYFATLGFDPFLGRLPVTGPRVFQIIWLNLRIPIPSQAPT